MNTHNIRTIIIAAADLTINFLFFSMVAKMPTAIALTHATIGPANQIPTPA